MLHNHWEFTSYTDWWLYKCHSHRHVITLNSPVCELKQMSFLTHTCLLLQMQITYLLMPFKISEPNLAVPEASCIFITSLIIDVRWLISPHGSFRDAASLVFSIMIYAAQQTKGLVSSSVEKGDWMKQKAQTKEKDLRLNYFYAW